MSKHNNRKLSAVCTEYSYIWLQNWIVAQMPNNPYPMTPLQFFYSKTSHREYLSKWLESVISKVLKAKGCDVIKSADAGTYRDNSKVVTDVLGYQRKIGSGGWTKNHNVMKGRADLKTFWGGKMYNFEIKVGKDKMSEHQKAEKTRAEANGEEYIIIKNIEDFLKLI